MYELLILLHLSTIQRHVGVDVNRSNTFYSTDIIEFKILLPTTPIVPHVQFNQLDQMPADWAWTEHVSNVTIQNDNIRYNASSLPALAAALVAKSIGNQNVFCSNVPISNLFRHMDDGDDDDDERKSFYTLFPTKRTGHTYDMRLWYLRYNSRIRAIGGSKPLCASMYTSWSSPNLITSKRL